MTELDLATKAPENDAQEDSSVDTPAQSSPMMGDHELCVTDRPARMCEPHLQLEAVFTSDTAQPPAKDQPVKSSS